jgi:hypothetical protein
MPYEVRVNGRTVAIHERQRDALAHVKQLVEGDASLETEIVNSETGKAAAPGATREDRENLAKKIGY